MIRFRAFTRAITLKPHAAIAAAAAAQKAHAHKVAKEASTYPPEKAGSNYVRTGELGKAYDVRGPSITASGISTRIVNNIYYFGYVQGEDQQLQHAQTGWKRLIDLADRETYHRAIYEAVSRSIF